MPILRKIKRKENGVEETVHLGALAQNITQDATHRFVTDTEKQAWNSKPGSTSGLDNNVVTFTEAATRENLQSGEKLSISLGKIKKWFSDLGAAAFMAVANNCTTTQPGSVLAAEQGKKLQDQISQVSSELYAPVSGTGAMSVVQAVTHICENFVGRQRSARGRFACADFIGGFDIISDESGNCSGTIVSESETLAYSFYRRAGADAVLKKLGNATFSMTWHHNAQANVVAGLYSSIDLPGNYDTLQVTPKTVSPSNTTIAFKVNGETKQTITSAGATIDLSQYNADIIKLEIYDPYNGRVQVIADITLS